MANIKNKMLRQGVIGLASLVAAAFPPQLDSLGIKNLPAKIAYEYTMPAMNVEAEPLPFSLDPIAGKSIYDRNEGEKSRILSKLVEIESSNNDMAVNRVVKRIRTGRETVLDTIYSIGRDQINISSRGALADYNMAHRRKFTPRDMTNPGKSRIVRDWYLFDRVPELLYYDGLKSSVANVLASYNTGEGNLKLAGGDAIRHFDRLPRITQDYIRNITNNSD